MSDVFDIRRFSSYFGNALFRGQMWSRSWLWMFVGTFVGMLGMLASILLSSSGDYADFENAYHMSLYLYMLLYSAIVTSMMFPPMRTKVRRAAFLMMPVSGLEKFLTAFLFVTVWSWLVFGVSLAMMELVRMGLQSLFKFGPEFYGESPVRRILSSLRLGVFGIECYDVRIYLSYGLLFWLQSVYALGAVRWRRYALQKTTAWLLAGFLLAVGFFALAGEEMPLLRTLVDEGYGDTVSFAVNVVFGVLTIVNWCWCYRLFKRIEL